MTLAFILGTQLAGLLALGLYLDRKITTAATGLAGIILTAHGIEDAPSDGEAGA